MTISASHVPSIPSRQMTLTLARDGVLALRQGGPCEAFPATRIFGFSQPPALDESPLPPLPSLKAPRLACRRPQHCRSPVAFLKKHKQRTVPLPPPHAPPPYQCPVSPHHRLIFAPSLPAKPPKPHAFFNHITTGATSLRSPRPRDHSDTHHAPKFSPLSLQPCRAQTAGSRASASRTSSSWHRPWASRSMCIFFTPKECDNAIVFILVFLLHFLRISCSAHSIVRLVPGAQRRHRVLWESPRRGTTTRAGTSPPPPPPVPQHIAMHTTSKKPPQTDTAFSRSTASTTCARASSSCVWTSSSPTTRRSSSPTPSSRPTSAAAPGPPARPSSGKPPSSRCPDDGPSRPSRSPPPPSESQPLPARAQRVPPRRSSR